MKAEAVKNKSHIRLSPGDRVFLAIVYTILALILIITLYPLIFVISASVSDPTAVGTGKMLLFPVGFTWQGYEYILRYKEIWVGYGNTLFYTVVGTVVNLAVTIPAGYALSRRDMHGRGIFMTMFLITMYFSGGLIPGYMNIRSLGLLNSRMVMIVSGALSTYNLIVTRTFFANTIPWDLHEAAFLDGAKDGQLFWKIILPLSKPIMVVMMLYYGVGHWNAYFSAMMYLTDRAKFPLQLFLKEILVQGSFASTALVGGGADFTQEELEILLKQADTANMLKYVVIIASTAPMLMIYPWLQKFFTKGVMIGSVKG